MKITKNRIEPINEVITIDAFNFINTLNIKLTKKKTEKESGENINNFSSKRSTDLPIIRLVNLLNLESSFSITLAKTFCVGTIG